MISKNKQKFIKSLGLKKFRDAEQLFIAEGPKVVGDLMGHYPCQILAGTSEYLSSHPEFKVQEICEITQKELEQISQLKTPRDVIAIFSQQKTGDFALLPNFQKDLVLVLDDIQDPGNLGTIIRIADWYGIRHIICSPHTADAFSPKVVQATMGALARVNVSYKSLTELFTSLDKSIPVYGTYLDGQDIYSTEITPNGIIVMGNEGNGITREVSEYINQRLYLPNYPKGVETSESLNVAVATAITCAEFRRRMS
jgi:TrmH family RNA methyltransferase